MFITKIKGSYLKNSLLINNILGTYFIKGLSLFISLFTLPAYLKYFSDQNVLGVWFTILSVLQWILTFDLGIGNGLRNKLVPLLVNNERFIIKKYISSAYAIIGIISLLTMILGSVSIAFLNWNNILKISTNVVSNDVLKLVLILIFTGIVSQFFLNLISSILFAMQKTALSNFISLVSSVLILLYVVFFKTGNIETDLINLAIVNILTVNVPLLVATVIVFSTILKDSKPNIRSYEKKFAFSILKLGGEFFWIQIALLFINSTNEVLITRLYGPENVVDYQVYFRLFYLVVTLFSLITNPVWSAIAKAYADKQYDWIINLNKKINLLVLLISVGNVLVLVVSQTIINIWLRREAININYGYASIFVLFSAISMYNIASSCFANGIGILRCQVICYSIAAIVKIPIVIVFSYFFKDWISVVVVNAVILLPYAIIQPRVLRKFYRSQMLKKQLDSLVINS
ncbi:hypothetical protein RCG17_11655 [Neobacillus sp. PS3-12]|uniref:hypothetical protein n=1 Tax=Neobacillus sp. PS3-12 TaxID=3070677 RepID=UPI0027E01ADA|nr:hypothetical protein [Neobacillus sp. PS3-12]WML55178.1 hypothetical protein RCG17_11655 [Neobacillus sp. PS3-12]